ncbi:S41 family peptidase [soil metagenome]
MSFRGKMWTLLISGVIAAYVMVGGLPFVGSMLQTQAQQPINDAGAQLRIFESVLQHIQNDYVDEPNLERVRNGALRGLASGLDPYSSYLTADQVRGFNDPNKSKKVGIGAEFSQLSQYLYVISVTKGSNAEKAGLKTGDVIEYIENQATRDISLYDAKQLVMGEPGTPINFRILRSGSKPQMIKIERGTYTIPTAEARVESNKTGVIKVFSLEAGEANDIRTQLQNLTKQGIDKIVLDLRSVATGSLTEAVDVSNLFIRDGEIAKVMGRNNQVTRTFSADPAKHVFNGKVAVLIDFGSAGPAEVIAGAILDRKRGEVVGERSFGAGAEQELFTLRGGDGLLLTTSKWASPSGTPFLGETRATMGVKPSFEVKRPETPEPFEVEEIIEQQENKITDPQPNATPTPSAEPAKVGVEDIQLKKAIEVLQGTAAAAKAAGE